MTLTIPNQTYYRWYNRCDRLRMRYPSELVVGFFVHNLRPGAKVLDLGCGSGRHVLLAAELGYRASGLDLADDGLSYCRALARARGLDVRLEQGSMSQTPYERHEFDAVVCVSALGGNTREEQRRTVAEMHRILRPGGVCLANFYGAKDMAAICGRSEGREVAPNTYVLSAYGVDPASESEVHEFLMHVSTRDEVESLFDGFTERRVFDVYLPFGNGQLGEDPEPSHLHYAMARK